MRCDVFSVIRNQPQTTKERQGPEEKERLLHMAQNNLRKLVWHLHLSSLCAPIPQHRNSHVHAVLCRQGPQCMCGGSPRLGCRYCGWTIDVRNEDIKNTLTTYPTQGLVCRQILKLTVDQPPQKENCTTSHHGSGQQRTSCHFHQVPQTAPTGEVVFGAEPRMSLLTRR